MHCKQFIKHHNQHKHCVKPLKVNPYSVLNYLGITLHQNYKVTTFRKYMVLQSQNMSEFSLVVTQQFPAKRDTRMFQKTELALKKSQLNDVTK